MGLKIVFLWVPAYSLVLLFSRWLRSTASFLCVTSTSLVLWYSQNWVVRGIFPDLWMTLIFISCSMCSCDNFLTIILLSLSYIKWFDSLGTRILLLCDLDWSFSVAEPLMFCWQWVRSAFYISPWGKHTKQITNVRHFFLINSEKADQWYMSTLCQKLPSLFVLFYYPWNVIKDAPLSAKQKKPCMLRIMIVMNCMY